MGNNTFDPPDNFIDLLLDVVCVVDRESYFVYVSAASERVFGYNPGEMVGRPVMDFVHPDDREQTRNSINDILNGEWKTHLENRYIRKDGKVVHIMWSARWSESDQVRVAVARDITQQKRAETTQKAVYAISQAAHEPGDLKVLLKYIHKVIKELLPADNFFIALCDPESEEIGFPYYVDEFNIAPTPQTIFSDTLAARVIRTGRAMLLTPETADRVVPKIEKANGRHAPNRLGVPLRSATGIIGALVVQSYSDFVSYSEEDRELLEFVSDQVASAVELRKMLTRLEYMAQHDKLTGLPDRNLFLDRLESSLKRARREQSGLAVLYIDLDEFKQVNDTYGHYMGDHVLREVANRLTRSVRQSDTAGRLGGDEFAVLLNDIKRPEDAGMIKEKISNALTVPFEISGKLCSISCSIGIAVFPENGNEIEALIHNADTDMYRNKRSSTNSI